MATYFDSVESSSGLPKKRSNVSTFIVHSGIPNIIMHYKYWYIGSVLWKAWRWLKRVETCCHKNILCTKLLCLTEIYTLHESDKHIGITNVKILIVDVHYQRRIQCNTYSCVHFTRWPRWCWSVSVEMNEKYVCKRCDSILIFVFVFLLDWLLDERCSQSITVIVMIILLKLFTNRPILLLLFSLFPSLRFR